MTAKLFILLFVAGSWTWAGVSAACAAQDVQNCQAPISQWTNGEPPKPKTKTDVDNICKNVKTVMDCLAPCKNESQNASNVFQKMDMFFKGVCNEMTYCMLDLRSCASSIIDITNIPSSASGLTEQQCKNYGELARCYFNVVPRHCKAINEIDVLAQKFLSVHYECLQDMCPALATCGRALEAGVTADGVGGACGHFQTFLGCVAGAQCDGMAVDRPPREPEQGADLKTLAQEACAVIETEKTALYACSAFQTCVTDFFGNAGNRRPDKLCSAIQSVVRCAVNNADCANVMDVETLKNKAFQFMLKAGIKGCGDPMFDSIDLGSCSALQTCATTLRNGVTVSGVGFGQTCPAAATFTTCATTAASRCNLTSPETQLSGYPMLSKMGSSVQELCTALSGKPAEQCEKLFECTGRELDFISSGTVGSLLNPNNWCSAWLRTVRCLENYQNACEVTDQVKTQLQTVRSKFVSNSGCQDEYTDSRAGAAAAGTLLMMVMLLFATVLL